MNWRRSSLVLGSYTRKTPRQWRACRITQPIQSSLPNTISCSGRFCQAFIVKMLLIIHTLAPRICGGARACSNGELGFTSKPGCNIHSHRHTRGDATSSVHASTMTACAARGIQAGTSLYPFLLVLVGQSPLDAGPWHAGHGERNNADGEHLYGNSVDIDHLISHSQRRKNQRSCSSFQNAAGRSPTASRNPLSRRISTTTSCKSTGSSPVSLSSMFSSQRSGKKHR